MVAKSYQGLEILCEPYELAKGRLYVKVRTKSGANKEVRWYTEAEYAKMYPEAKEEVKPAGPTDRKTALGFKNGYITIFKGDTYSYLDWFRSSSARFARPWGWYFTSETELPTGLPADLTPITLNWEDVSVNDVLKSETDLKLVVENLIYEPLPSEFVGEIGDRLDLILTVDKALAIDSNFGHSTMHVLKDSAENIYIWTTSAKTLIEGNTYHIRGTVKDHRTYRATKQTILTRCNVK